LNAINSAALVSGASSPFAVKKREANTAKRDESETVSLTGKTYPPSSGCFDDLAGHFQLLQELVRAVLKEHNAMNIPRYTYPLPFFG
jgi:hypothetical protein